MNINSCPSIAKSAIYITSHLVFYPFNFRLAVDLIISKLVMFETFPAKVDGETWGHHSY